MAALRAQMQMAALRAECGGPDPAIRARRRVLSALGTGGAGSAVQVRHPVVEQHERIARVGREVRRCRIPRGRRVRALRLPRRVAPGQGPQDPPGIRVGGKRPEQVAGPRVGDATQGPDLRQHRRLAALLGELRDAGQRRHQVRVLLLLRSGVLLVAEVPVVVDAEDVDVVIPRVAIQVVLVEAPDVDPAAVGRDGVEQVAQAAPVPQVLDRLPPQGDEVGLPVEPPAPPEPLAVVLVVGPEDHRDRPAGVVGEVGQEIGQSVQGGGERLRVRAAGQQVRNRLHARPGGSAGGQVARTRRRSPPPWTDWPISWPTSPTTPAGRSRWSSGPTTSTTASGSGGAGGSTGRPTSSPCGGRRSSTCGTGAACTTCSTPSLPTAAGSTSGASTRTTCMATRGMTTSTSSASTTTGTSATSTTPPRRSSSTRTW